METGRTWLDYWLDVSRNHVMRLALLVAAFGCSLQNYADLQEGSVATGGRNAGSGGQSRGGSSGTSTSTGLGGMTSNGGTSDTAGGSTRIASGGTSAVGATSSPAGTFGPWEFDTLEEALQWPASGLTIPVGSTVSWTAQGENEPLGALVLTATGPSTFQLTVPPANANQLHRKVFFRARSESGTAKIKPYVFSLGWKWADGGEFPLSTEWSTAVMDLDNPSWEGAGYDATTLINIGLEVPCPSTPTEPVTWVIWIDRAWME